MKHKFKKATSWVFIIVIVFVVFLVGVLVRRQKVQQALFKSDISSSESQNKDRENPASPAVTSNLNDIVWKKYQSESLGIEFKLPQEWEYNSQEFSIMPKDGKGAVIEISTFGWPDFIKDKVGKKFSIAQALTDKSIGFSDKYFFVKDIKDNKLNNITTILGSGVEFVKTNTRYRSASEPNAASEEKWVLIFSEKTGETYFFKYSYFADSYDQNIDDIFQEIVKSATLLR